MSSLNPNRANKVDVSSLSPEEQRIFKLYGKLPTQKDVLSKKINERKYFDSGDYAMSRAGRVDSVDAGQVGLQHPNPEKISKLQHNGCGGGSCAPGGSSPSGVQSPIKESSQLSQNN